MILRGLYLDEQTQCLVTDLPLTMNEIRKLSRGGVVPKGVQQRAVRFLEERRAKGRDMNEQRRKAGRVGEG